MITKTVIAITVAVMLSGCFGNEPKPCVPIVIKEPFEVKTPIQCVHPTCDKPIPYIYDRNMSYVINAKYLKANGVLKDKYSECLESSILTCERPTGLIKPN